MDHFESAFDLYRQMAANIPDCSIYVFNHDFEYLLAEGEEVNKLGVATETLIGCNFFEIWPQEVTMTLSPYYLDTLKGKRQKLEHTTEDGVFIQHFIPIFDINQVVVAGMVVSQNVSILSEVKQELNARDAELRDKQRLFETVINTVGEGIIVSNTKGDVMLSNPAADELFGQPLLGKKLNELSENIVIKYAGSGVELQNEELPFWMALRGARLDGYTTEVDFGRDDSKVTHIENSARPLLNANKEIEGAVLVMRDVSARAELEAIVEENLISEKQKNSRLEHFMTKLSSNLLGPTANLNVLYSLLEKTKDPDEYESYIKKIGEVIKLLQGAVGNISSAMRMYSSTQEEWGVNRFEKAIEDFVAKYYQYLDEKNITLNCDFNKAPEMAYPAKQFDGIISNLLKNILQLCGSDSKEIVLKSFKKHDAVSLRIHSDVISAEELNGMERLEGKFDSKFSGFKTAKEQVEVLGGRMNISEGQIQIIF